MANGIEMRLAFTTDLDWAPEKLTERLFKVFEDRDVPVQPFITHDSVAVKRRFEAGDTRVGVHPNFWANSTHGEYPQAVLDHVWELWPGARSYRSHSYWDGQPLWSLAYLHGARYDANTFCWLGGCRPWKLRPGLTRFPTVWEDEIHALYGRSFDEELQLKGGLSVLNVHPQWVALNLETHEQYEAAKEKNWKVRPRSKKGARYWLERFLDKVAARGIDCVYLDDAWIEMQMAKR